MNTGLQCLYATEDLAKYFLQDFHIKEGLDQREGVKYFSSLIKQIWLKPNSKGIQLGKSSSGDWGELQFNADPSLRLREYVNKKGVEAYQNFNQKDSG